MTKEGVIKFKTHWHKGPALPEAQIAPLNAWRDKLYALGLIGSCPDGVGYGNISVRDGSGFLITGSGTGALVRLSGAHYTRVTAYDFAANSLHCTGPVKASSESFTHAALYESCPAVQAVIHVHSARLWHALVNRVPTTAPQAAYGTIEIAGEIQRLMRDECRETCGIIVTAGHAQGLIAFGTSLDKAGEKLLRYARPAKGLLKS